MAARRRPHWSMNFHPISDRGNFAKWHTGLHHAERSRIHADQYDAFRSVTEVPDVLLVRLKCVRMRVIDVCDRVRKVELREVVGECAGRVDQRITAVDRLRREGSFFILGGQSSVSIRQMTSGDSGTGVQENLSCTGVLPSGLRRAR